MFAPGRQRVTVLNLTAGNGNSQRHETVCSYNRSWESEVSLRAEVKHAALFSVDVVTRGGLARSLR
jgi:hypothetical protein